MGVVTMSGKDFSRLDVLLDVEAGRLAISDACDLMGLRRRQVFRLLAALRQHGAAGLISKRRGRPSNNRLPVELRELAMGLVRERYADFGPTLACEKLAALHGCPVSRETLRKWMIEEGLWVDRKHRLPSVHQPRLRRDRVGELIQIDGSKHYWFENRGPECTLLAFIDDATSRIMHAAFVHSESAFDYLRETRAYVSRYGRPIAFYSDKHSIFRVSKRDAVGGTGMTQFGRALDELNIDIICANTAPAKGRVERAFGTLQDRLIKEMRLAGVDTMDAGNDYLAIFLQKHNDRFGKAPFSSSDGHRPIQIGIDLDDVFAWKEERTVTNSLTLQYDKVTFILEPNAVTRPLARKRVQVVDYPDGRFAIRHQGLDLPFRTFDRIQRVDQAAIVENKRLGPILAFIAERQKEREEGRSQKAPRRRGQAERHLFKSG